MASSAGVAYETPTRNGAATHDARQLPIAIPTGGTTVMAKGVEKKATTNKAKLSIKEKQAKKKEKAAAKGK